MRAEASRTPAAGGGRWLAAAEGTADLTERHWQVIKFIRHEYEAKGTGPTVRVLGKTSGVSVKELYQLFPKGPAKVAANAGLYACKASTDLFGLAKSDFIDQVKDIITVGEFYAERTAQQDGPRLAAGLRVPSGLHP